MTCAERARWRPWRCSSAASARPPLLAPYPLGLRAAASLRGAPCPRPRRLLRLVLPASRCARCDRAGCQRRRGGQSYFVQLTAAYETLLTFSVTMPATAPPRGTTRGANDDDHHHASPPPRPPSRQLVMPSRTRGRGRPTRSSARASSRCRRPRPGWRACRRRSCRPTPTARAFRRRGSPQSQRFRPAQRVAQGGRRRRRGRVPRAVRTGERRCPMWMCRAHSQRAPPSHPGGRASLRGHSQGGGGGGRAAADEFSP